MKFFVYLNLCQFFLAAATATIEGKMSKSLKSLMKKVLTKEVHEELAVADAKLGSVIKVCMPAILGDLNGFFTNLVDQG